MAPEGIDISILLSIGFSCSIYRPCSFKAISIFSVVKNSLQRMASSCKIRSILGLPLFIFVDLYLFSNKM